MSLIHLLIFSLFSKKTQGFFQKTQGNFQKTQGIFRKTQGNFQKTQEIANFLLELVAEKCPKKACLYVLIFAIFRIQ